jgi:AcrR family transcriptional regulator
MQMIADQAEISVGKLYLHFEGKEDIYRSVVEHHYEEIKKRALQAIDPSMAPIDMIRMRTGAVLGYIEENEAFVRFYVSEMEGVGRGCCHLDGSEHKMHMSEITDLIREAIERGDIPDEDPEMITAMIHGAAHAMMALVVERGDMPIRAVAEYVDRMILRPLEGRKRDEKRRRAADEIT